MASETAGSAETLTKMDGLETPMEGTDGYRDESIEAEGEVDEIPVRRGIRALPDELLVQIFSRFDREAPSLSKLKDQPAFDITSSPTTTLKDCSLVCTRWRRIVIPVLYKHASLIIRDPIFPKPILRNEHFPMLNFFRIHNLKPFVKSFVLCIADKWRPGTVHIDDDEVRRNDFSAFWTKIFQNLDLHEIIVVCNPMALGAVACCSVDSTDAWNFDMPYQYLYLSLPSVGAPPSSKTPSASSENHSHERAQSSTRSSTLFEARPWHTILLNEGSFIKAYKTYEFFQKKPPSILSDLIGARPIFTAHVKLIPPTVRDFSYIGLFPTSQHFHQLAAHLPRLDRLYTQFVPRNDILLDPEAMAHLDPGDLWMERNSCYAYIMRELFSSPPAGNYAFLKEFESGDHADEDAWEMAVEYVKRAGRGWKIEKRGVFVKDLEEAKRWEEAENEAYGGIDTPPSLLSVPNSEAFDPEP